MRWFCVAFGTIVVVSTALSHAGAASGDPVVASPLAATAIVSVESNRALALDIAEMSSAHHIDHGAAWSAIPFLGLPFLIRRRRERLS